MITFARGTCREEGDAERRAVQGVRSPMRTRLQIHIRLPYISPLPLVTGSGLILSRSSYQDNYVWYWEDTESFSGHK